MSEVITKNNFNKISYKDTPTELYNAIGVLKKELSEDKSEGSYYHSWQSNIAIVFIDEYNLYDEDDSDDLCSVRQETIEEIVNSTAKRFLDILIK